MSRPPKQRPVADETTRWHLPWGILLATLVSAGALVLAAIPARQPWGVATAPFGWNRVIIIYSCSTILLTWWLAQRMNRWESMRWLVKSRAIWTVLGIGVTGYTLLAGPVVGLLLTEWNANFTERAVCRILWCVALQLPWLMLVISFAKVRQHDSLPYLSAVHLLLLGIVTAIGVPASFFAVFLEEQTSQAREHWAQMQVARAVRVAQRLHDVGSSLPIGERLESQGTFNTPVSVSPRDAIDELEVSLLYLEEQLAELLAKGNARQEQDNRDLVSCYLALDQIDLALETLAPLSQRDPWAALRRAKLLADRKRAEEASDAAKQAIALAQQQESTEQLENLQYDAYEILAVTAGERGDFEASERYLTEALERLPSRRADVHDFLAKHFEFLGNYARAAEHQTAAATAAPDRYAPPEAYWRKVISHGAPVGLARPKSSRYN